MTASVGVWHGGSRRALVSGRTRGHRVRVGRWPQSHAWILAVEHDFAGGRHCAAATAAAVNNAASEAQGWRLAAYAGPEPDKVMISSCSPNFRPARALAKIQRGGPRSLTAGGPRPLLARPRRAAWLLRPGGPRGAMSSSFREQWQALRAAPRELPMVYLIKILTSFGLYSTTIVLTLLLSDTPFAMDDVAAGWTFGIFGFLISFYGLLIGFLIDALGTQRSLVLGSCLLICGRLLLAVAVDTTTLYLALYLTIPLGEALAIPVLTVMLKRYTLPQNRAAAYSLFYVTMNLGAVLSGWAVQLLSDNLPPEGLQLLPVGRVWSVYRCVVLAGWVAQLLVLPLALSMRAAPPGLVEAAARPVDGAAATDGAQARLMHLRVDEEQHPRGPEVAHGHGDGAAAVGARASRDGSGGKRALRATAETVLTRRFWRFLLLTSALITIKHSLWSESLTPKFMLRSFGTVPPLLLL
eukprot:COSAG06_NODE_50_length_28525_cov_88.227010_17_plen_467_part_00